MNAVFNGNFIDSSSVSLDNNNRAFLYGDGLFETIIVRNNAILFLADHIDRLHRGMKILKLKPSALLTLKGLTESIDKLLQADRLTEARVKLLVWRKPGGLFVPEQEEADYLITCHSLNLPDVAERRVDFCTSVQLHESIYSEFKRISSIPYILAGIELKERGLDDLILLDYEGNVSECIYSNIFWKEKNKYFTPSLNTGCISGIRRRYLIQKFKKNSIQIEEVRCKPEELLSADHIFSTNVAGIYPITLVGTQKFGSYIPDL